MIKELTNYLMNVCYKHNGVHTIKYQTERMINQQPTNKYYEVVIDDEPILKSTSTEGIITIEYNIIILGKDDLLTAQDNALHIGLDVINYIDNAYNIYPIRVQDYSFIGLSDYTDDKAHGVRLTLELVIPNPINLCEYNFDDDKDFLQEPKEIIDLSDEDECTNVTIVKNENNNITLNPIKLK